jgi:hypothetical protein
MNDNNLPLNVKAALLELEAKVLRTHAKASVRDLATMFLIMAMLSKSVEPVAWVLVVLSFITFVFGDGLFLRFALWRAQRRERNKE